MLVTSIFLFSHNVFYPMKHNFNVMSNIKFVVCKCFQFVQIFSSVNPFPNKPWFLRVCRTSLENTVGKGEIAHNEQFLLFPQCFLSIWKTFYHSDQIRNCRLQALSVWKSLNFVVWERVKVLTSNSKSSNIARKRRNSVG